MKVCVFPFPKKGNNGITKKYIKIALRNLAANIKKKTCFTIESDVKLRKSLGLLERPTTSHNLTLVDTIAFMKFFPLSLSQWVKLKSLPPSQFWRKMWPSMTQKQKPHVHVASMEAQAEALVEEED